MIDQPISYTADDGGKWHPRPSEFQVSNPELMTLPEGHYRRYLVIKSHETPGAYLRVHALKWADGSRWDARNGMTQGELPR